MDQDVVKTLKGTTIRDTEGTTVGKVADVYVDDETGEAQWVTVRTGAHGKKESFVPVGSATFSGDVLTVAVTAARIEGAPVIDPDGNLSEKHEKHVYRYYDVERGAATGLDITADGSAGGAEADRSAAADAEAAEAGDAGAGGASGRGESGSGTDDAMTRSEERLTVGTEQREAGRVRLRKYVDTEVEQVEVRVTRERARVEREPITDDNRDRARSGPDFTEAEHEVTLREERPVVEKEAVPVERVRLDKETVTDTETVAEEVRKERVEVEGEVEGR